MTILSGSTSSVHSQLTEGIATKRLRIRLPNDDDAEDILHYYARNVEHHSTFATRVSEETLKIDAICRQIRDAITDLVADRAVRTYVFVDESVIGSVNLFGITRGAFNASYLGYHLDKQSQGNGYMTEAVAAVVTFGFEQLLLHRIMANYVPWNRKSHRVLERLGFVVEGYAKSYLLINGTWEDHVLTSLTNQTWSAHSA